MITTINITEKSIKRRDKMKILFAALAVCAVLFNACFVSGALSQNLDNVVVYPNPFEPKLGHTKVTFDNLTGYVRIKIYKKTGELIYEKVTSTTDGRADWNLINNDGSGVASGIYLYLISSGDSKCSGKIAVLK
jgi:hypothetical protein